MKSPAKKPAKKKKVEKQVKTVHVAFLVDRSGSMASIRNDVIGGFNTFLADQQKEPGTCNLTLAQFDTGGFDILISCQDIHTVREATPADFQPRGGTPLLDAIGKLVAHASARTVDNPTEQVIVVILTDGHENASQEYTNESIRSLITAKEAAGWVFVYLGANVDAFSQASAMGMNVASAQNYIPDAVGTRRTYAGLSANVRLARVAAAAGQSVTSSNFTQDTSAQDDYIARSGGQTPDQQPDPNHWSSHIPTPPKPTPAPKPKSPPSWTK